MNIGPATGPGGVDLSLLEGAPVHTPGGGALDELELILDGSLGVPPAYALPGTEGSSPETGVSTLVVPGAVADAAEAAGRLGLTDEEGTPLALLEVCDRVAHPDGSAHLAGTLVPLRAPARGHFRSLRRSAAELRTLTGGSALAVALRTPPSRFDLETVARRAGGRRVLLLPLTGAGAADGASPEGLVRAAVAAQGHLAATGLEAHLTPLPLPAGRVGSLPAVARALGCDVLLELPTGVAPEVAAALDAGRAALPGHWPAASEEELRRHRPPLSRRGLVLLLTGLSGSGKSTVARALAERLVERGDRTLTLLDGDDVRRLLSAGLTFSREHRDLNVRRIGWVAAEVARHGGIAVCAPIAPYAAAREEVRAFVEGAGGVLLVVHVSTPLAECERRDRKGLYAKARAGLIPHFTGISDPYEVPTDADLSLDTATLTVDAAVDRLLHLLTSRGHLAGAPRNASED